jgi:hypothetical protein
LYEQDWAIIKIEHLVGEKYGWMDIESHKLDEYRDLHNFVNLSLSGYSEDKYSNNPGLHKGCSIKGVVSYAKTTMVTHDCDCTKGSSGGALFYQPNSGRAKIVALNFASFPGASPYLNAFTPYYANLAIATSMFSQISLGNESSADLTNSTETLIKDDIQSPNIIYVKIAVAFVGGVVLIAFVYKIYSVIKSCVESKSNILDKAQENSLSDLKEVQVL